MKDKKFSSIGVTILSPFFSSSVSKEESITGSSVVQDEPLLSNVQQDQILLGDVKIEGQLYSSVDITNLIKRSYNHDISDIFDVLSLDSIKGFYDVVRQTTTIELDYSSIKFDSVELEDLIDVSPILGKFDVLEPQTDSIIFDTTLGKFEVVDVLDDAKFYVELSKGKTNIALSEDYWSINPTKYFYNDSTTSDNVFELDLSRNIRDGVNAEDLVSIPDGSTFTLIKTKANVLYPYDTFSKSVDFNRSFAHSTGSSDTSFIFDVNKRFYHSSSSADTVFDKDVSKLLVDSSGSADTVFDKSFVKALTHSTPADDTAFDKSFIKVLTHSAPAADTVFDKGVDKVFAHGINVEESFVNVISFVRKFNHSSGSTDTVFDKDISKLLNHSTSGADTVFDKNFNKGLSFSVSIQELFKFSYTAGRVFSDQASANDSGNVYIQNYTADYTYFSEFYVGDQTAFT